MTRRVKVVVGASLALIAVAIAVTLSQAPLTLASRNSVESSTLLSVRQRARFCQPDETLPRGASAIRLAMTAYTGPRVAVSVLAGGRVLTSGERGSGWTGDVVTIPVKPLPAATSGATLCFTLFLNGDETAYLLGVPSAAAVAASGAHGALPGRVTVEYVRPGRSSWWSLAPSVARRMGLGHAASGTWGVALVLLLMGGVVLVCARALVEGSR